MILVYLEKESITGIQPGFPSPSFTTPVGDSIDVPVTKSFRDNPCRHFNILLNKQVKDRFEIKYIKIPRYRSLCFYQSKKSISTY